MKNFENFKEINFVDFEFQSLPGERPKPVCMVAKGLRSGKETRLWHDDLKGLKRSPFGDGANELFISYFASAELGCFLSLDWECPKNVIDLYVEFRNLTNGLTLPAGRSLLGALAYFGIVALEASEKEEMRNLVLRGGPWTGTEKIQILDYCASDVYALEKLFDKMSANIGVPRALVRGDYMKTVAKIEPNGIPVDKNAFDSLVENWPYIKSSLIERVNEMFGVFEGSTFKSKAFEKLLDQFAIPWPRLHSGRLDLAEETFRAQVRAYPILAPIHEVRSNLSKLKLNDLTVGADARNRVLLSPFASKTGRNQPSTSKNIFGTSTWMRHLIVPPPNKAIAYIDYEQQEFGIAAALSDDPVMKVAYSSGDPYLAFAKQAGAVPDSATKATHKALREQFKQCVLAVQYGMGPESLARKINQPIAQARWLLKMHKTTFRKFWDWSNAVVDQAMLHRILPTVFGWTLHVDDGANERSLRNFPMQGNGAEILRLACVLVSEKGVKICAPVHDALLIEDDIDKIEDSVAVTQEAMAEASRQVLPNFELRSDAKIVKHPDRYTDERGQKMWEMVRELLESKVRHPRTDEAPLLLPCAPVQSTSIYPYKIRDSHV